jgi:hypothetical protein
MRNITVCEPSENGFCYREWWFHTVSFGYLSCIAGNSFNRNSCEDPSREVKVVVVLYPALWCVNHSVPCNIKDVASLTHIVFITKSTIVGRIDSTSVVFLITPVSVSL